MRTSPEAPIRRRSLSRSSSRNSAVRYSQIFILRAGQTKTSGNSSQQSPCCHRLQEVQLTSAYAAEALPAFLVAINDSDRAYALANSLQFPAVIQSDFGRRRLTLARLNAAFKLAVRDGDLDRVLGITMRLAQVAAANSRGDQFIRRSPSLAVILGDPDAYRRLFNDRSGWRGARDARLTVAHAFSNEMEEAKIHCDRVIGWINWNARQPRDEREFPQDRSGPQENDFAAIIFLEIVQGGFKSVDGNLCQWNRSFALSVAQQAIKLARQYECATGAGVLDSLATFAATAKCKSFALKVSLLRSVTALTSQQRRALARSLKAMSVKPEEGDRTREWVDGDIIYAAFAALIYDSAASASRVLRAVTQIRPSSYDYGERHGPSNAWWPILRACVAAWSQKRIVAVHDLLPRDVKITKTAKTIKTEAELKSFLAALPASRRKRGGVRRSKKNVERQFNSRECEEIARGIETVLQVIEPFQAAMLAQDSDKGLAAFLANWQQHLPKEGSRQFEEPHHRLSRTIGLGFAKLLVQHAPDITEADAAQMIAIVSGQRFRLSDRSSLLVLFASRPGLHHRSGEFAQLIAGGIRKDDYIEQRGDDYALLAEALIEMSVAEAREYYRNGLSELDKLGSNDYDLIYALLNYSAVQPGGLIRPELGHRLMNLSQTICSHEPSKFGWTLFARASAKSVGTTAATKLVRWGDQEVADFSYGLPQLACFLATERHLSPRRAAALLTICRDHGWYEWRLGDGVADLFAIVADADERRKIFAVVFGKLKLEHSSGGWSSVWEGLLALAEKFPGAASEADVGALRRLLTEAERKRDEFNARSSSAGPTVGIATHAAEVDPESALVALVSTCDPASSSSIDEALHAIKIDSTLPYFTQRRFFEKLRESCPYDERLTHLMALAEAVEIPADHAIDRIEDCVAAWAASSAHVAAQIKGVIEHFFKSKGSELFSLDYGNISRELHQLIELCGDADFVLRQVLNTIVTERIDLDGEEWLQLATTLCKQTSTTAAREALENFLSGPAAGLADDIGEGRYKASFHIEGECALLSGIVWHLLGDSDAYVRWATARALSAFVDLGLIDELDALLDQFDRTDVPALKSEKHCLSFQNSQQWLLMGLARAALIHGPKLASIKPRLLKLAARADVHVVHKRHILRCLVNIGSDESEIASLREEVTVDPKGIVVVSGWPKHVGAKSGFTFDYEFMKSEVSRLARLFRISDGQSTDAIADEIKRLWPQANDMDFFPGHDRYRRERSDRYEFYREHVQKHGMLGAATTLRNPRPVARDSYDQDPTSPFAQWLKDYDVTFDDGSWLADHKDEVPENANASFMGPRIGNKESIVEAAAVFERLGLINSTSGAMVPIFGQWCSPDEVHIRIVSALGRMGRMGSRCRQLPSSPKRGW